MIKEHRRNPEPLELLDEIALLRALTHDSVERWEAIMGEGGMLQAWHESCMSVNTPASPAACPIISSISLIVDRIGSMVERVQKIQAAQSLTSAQVQRVMKQFGIETAMALAQAGLSNEQEQRIISSIEARWLHIQLHPAR